LMETLESIKAQDYLSWEVLVVDDGSDDQQWTELQKLSTERIRIIERTDGIKGPSRCRNLGVAESRGDYIVFVDSDDLLAPWCLSQRMIKAAEHLESVCWIFPVMLFRQQPGDLAICWNRLVGDDDLERFLRSDPPWHTSSPVWRKDAFMALGGFNENVMYGDDAELHTRALLRGINCRKFTDCLPDAFIRRGEQQRITNAQLSSLMPSRQARLAEGTRLLQECNADSYLVRLWEGQYIVECEELLFNSDDSAPHIDDVLSAWSSQYQPGSWHRWCVYSYFRIAGLCRDQAYWALRLARRLAMTLLPCEYFPKGGGFQNWMLSDRQLEEIRETLRSFEHRSLLDSGVEIFGS
jgi:glycosyltransferase involved in cell wall biosynthesis